MQGQGLYLLYSSIVTVVVGLGLGWYFNWRANKLTKKLTIEIGEYIIKQCGDKIVHPIFNKNGKIIGSNIVKIVNEKETIGENNKIVKQE